MLVIKELIKNKEEIIEKLKKRNVDYTETIEKIIELYNKKNALQVKLDNLRNIRKNRRVV